MNGISLVEHTLTRLHIVCEAIGISPDDVNVEDFPPEARARWRYRAHEDVRRAINDDPSCIAEQRPNTGLYRALRK